jgi:Holliday junction resolvase RusA-like endonuclease
VGVKKDGKPFSYKTSKGKKQEQDFISLLMPFQPNSPMQGSIKLEIDYRLPFLKSEKKAIVAMGEVFHDRKPDLDNLIKMFQDTMGKLRFWNDDSQVVFLVARKYRSSIAGIRVKMEPLETEGLLSKW